MPQLVPTSEAANNLAMPGEFISDITAPDDASEQFERRYLFTRGAAKNLVIVFSAGALVASTAFIPVVGPVVAASLGLLTIEAMKKSKPFNDLSAPIRKGLDDLSESEVDLERLKKIPREQLEKMRDFVIDNQDILRRVGGSSREMQWFRDVLEWISSSEGETPSKQLPLIPPIDQHIIIVGTRGSGKTATGKLLAQRLKVEFTSLNAEWDPTDAGIAGIDHAINAAPQVIAVSVASYENSQFWQKASGKAKFVLLDNVSDPSRYDRDQERLRSSLDKWAINLWIETSGENQVEEVVERIMSKLLRHYLL